MISASRRTSCPATNFAESVGGSGPRAATGNRVGELVPRKRLATIRELARQYNTNFTAVREGLSVPGQNGPDPDETGQRRLRLGASNVLRFYNTVDALPTVVMMFNDKAHVLDQIFAELARGAGTGVHADDADGET